jgi:hypothetical protein
MVEAACALQIPIRDPRRLSPLILGLICMLAWVVFLRAGSSSLGISPFTAWTMSALSVAVPLSARRPLRRALI